MSPSLPLQIIVDSPPQDKEFSLHDFSTSDNIESSGWTSPTPGSLTLDSILPSPGSSNSLLDLPPPSASSSGASSALASDSELPSHSSYQSKKQAGIQDFFSVIPPEEFYGKWWKWKLEDQEKNEREFAKRKKGEEKEKAQKKACRQEQNQHAQRKVREKNKQKAMIGLTDDTE